MHVTIGCEIAIAFSSKGVFTNAKTESFHTDRNPDFGDADLPCCPRIDKNQGTKYGTCPVYRHQDAIGIEQFTLFDSGCTPQLRGGERCLCSSAPFRYSEITYPKNSQRAEKENTCKLSFSSPSDSNSSPPDIYYASRKFFFPVL